MAVQLQVGVGHLVHAEAGSGRGDQGSGPLTVLCRRLDDLRQCAGKAFYILGPDQQLGVGRKQFLQEATLLAFPSEWYEGFPMTLLEAFATGLPVIASRIGSVAEVVEHDRTGRHFRPGDPQDLAAQVGWLIDHPEARADMGRVARQTYLNQYTAERNGQLLLDIYRRAQWQAKAGVGEIQPKPTLGP